MEIKKVFVTVGTTKFDELIRTILDEEVLRALNNKGYNHLTIQTGISSIIPDCIPRSGFLVINYFPVSPSLENHIKSADLVISHAGAGTCLETLEAKKPLIVVTNQTLMNNHQIELAEQLYKDGHLLYCTCDTLLETIQNLDLSKLKTNFNDKCKQIAETIDQIMGF